MTVITKLKQTVSGLKSAQASLEGFALDTDNQQAKQLFQTAAQQTQTIIDSLNPRVEEVNKKNHNTHSNNESVLLRNRKG